LRDRWRRDDERGGWSDRHGEVIGHHVKPARPVVLLQYMLYLVGERRGLHDGEHDHEQRAHAPPGRHTRLVPGAR
jgi:hypothetical protein